MNQASRARWIGQGGGVVLPKTNLVNFVDVITTFLHKPLDLGKVLGSHGQVELRITTCQSQLDGLHYSPVDPPTSGYWTSDRQ